MPDLLDRYKKALAQLESELPDLMEAEEAQQLSAELQRYLAQGDMSSLVQSAKLAASEDVVRRRVQQLLGLDLTKSVRGLPGDPQIKSHCYQCQNEPPHLVNEADIEQHDVEGYPLCPYDGTILHKIADEPCPPED